MPIVQFTPQDLLRSTIVTPAWYRVHISAVGESPTTTEKGPSINYPVEGTILFNADNGDTTFAGVPTPGNWQFNSKAISMAIGFLTSLGVEVKADQRYDLGAAAGHDIDVFIGNGSYNNRVNNQITHEYRIPNPAVTAVTK